MFVIGTEDMSRRRFLWMCQFEPDSRFYTLCFVFDFSAVCRAGLVGMICISMGFGDYLNVYTALRQMPKKASNVFERMHSYWYFANDR